MSAVNRSVSISLQGVSKYFGTRGVFRNLNLVVAPGEFLAVVGPSGCGKSTLLRLVAGLEAPAEGSVSIQPEPHTGFVFQEALLLPWRTVEQNVLLPLELQGFPVEQRGNRVKEALRRVRMDRDAALYPSQLSGGMKMRVSLARALVTEPTLLLLDEPFAALDELSRVILEEELRQLWSHGGMTIVFVTHSFSEAVFLSDRVVMLSPDKQGIGDSVLVSLGERNGALRLTPGFAEAVYGCRTRFENLHRGGA